MLVGEPCYWSVWLQGIPFLKKDINEIISVAYQVGGKGFSDMADKESEALIDGHGEELREEEGLEDLMKSAEEDEV